MSSSVDDQDQKIYRDQQIAKSKGKKRKKGGKAGGGKGNMSPSPRTATASCSSGECFRIRVWISLNLVHEAKVRDAERLDAGEQREAAQHLACDHAHRET